MLLVWRMSSMDWLSLRPVSLKELTRLWVRQLERPALSCHLSSLEPFQVLHLTAA